MAKESKIQWTEATWNPFHGCRKVSPGCRFCYMYRDKERWKQDPTTVLKSKNNFNDPLSWKEPKLIFTCSWSDWFISEADAWRPEAWEIIKRTPQHTYQILTKRPERIAECLPPDWGAGYPNVWLGTSIESQDQIERAWRLLDSPSKVYFLSLEPLIGPVSLNSAELLLKNWRNIATIGRYIDWVIIGGESGNENGRYRYRPCQLKWIEDIIEECKTSEVPVFVKQLGTHLSRFLHLSDRHGGDSEEWPVAFQIRQMPKLSNHG